MPTRFYLENLKERDYFEETEEDQREVLKWILRK
jgi:hypothetical protein